MSGDVCYSFNSLTMLWLFMIILLQSMLSRFITLHLVLIINFSPFARWWLGAEKMKSLPLASTLVCSTILDLDRFALFPEKCILFITCVSISHRIALTVGQQLVLYLALLSCSLCSVKLHVVLLFDQIKKKKKKKKKNFSKD